MSELRYLKSFIFIQYISTVGLYPFLKEFEEVSIWTKVFLTALGIRIRRIRMFLGPHGPDPLVRVTVQLWILPFSHKGA
jgi:hypothetical protein